MTFLTTGLLIIALQSTAHAGTPRTEKDWQQLFTTCETNWAQYESELTKLRGDFKRELERKTQDEFLKLFIKDDPMIQFARIHWPTLFEAKDTGWMLYQGCAERNMKVRNLLNSPTPSRAERKEKIESLDGCLRVVFAPRGPLPKIFDRLLACYNKQNK